jgi:hypothetical protein
MGAEQSGPVGPPTNAYWTKRKTEATWVLRERLLNGDVREVGGGDGSWRARAIQPRSETHACLPCAQVCDMLKLPLPQEYREYTDPWAAFKGWFEKKNVPAKTLLPANFDVFEHVWADDGGHSAFHYLCIGRQRTNYAGWKTK